MDKLNSIKEKISSFFHPDRALDKRMRITSGLSLNQKSVEFSGTKRVLHALTNALLMFSFTAGTTAALAGAFNIKYHTTLLMFVFGLFSLIFSLMNCKKLWQNIGYLVFFVLYTFLLISNRQFINSGLNGFLNDFFSYASDKWHMDVAKNYNEAFPEQHLLTITMFFMMVGLAVMLMINFVFNNEKSPLTVFVVIFPFLQLGLYFDEIPSFFSIILIITALLCCYCMRHNFQFVMPMAKKEVITRHYKKKHFYIQYSNGRVVLQVFAVILSFVLVFSGFAGIIAPPASYQQNERLLSAKKATEETVREVLLYGLSSLFKNGDESGPGGISNGSLGNVGTVRSDFLTDFSVTFAPYAYETLYLKGAVFTTYTGNKWDNLFIEPIDNTSREESKGLLNMESDYLEGLYGKDPMVLKGKMKVKVEDPMIMDNTLLLPYHSLIRGDEYEYRYFNTWRMPYLSLSDDVPEPPEITYYVYQNIWDSELYDKPVATDYDRFVHENYLSTYGLVGNNSVTVTDGEYLYEDSKEVGKRLMELCREQGFHGSTKEIISQLQAFFRENYTYTLNPGRTPSGTDFVTHFLFDSKKGYCSYFATAGTLLLRSMGIPARYVEGYVLSMNDVVDADILEDESYDDWLEGDALVGKTAVVNAQIDDSRAHAWCEVYLNGFGWVPVEFTPPSDDNEDDVNYDSLWNRLTADDNAQNNFNMIANIMDSRVSGVLAVLIRAVLAVIAGIAAFILIRLIRRRINELKGIVPFYTGYNAKIVSRYQRLCERVCRHGLSDNDNLTAERLSDIISKNNNGRIDAGALREFMDIYKDAAYGSEPVSREVYDKWYSLFKHIIKSI